PLAGLSDLAGVYHYCAFDHVLERRRILPEPVWKRLSANLPPHGFFVALTTIYWRESWKYGERAFRYCNHDVGHAVAALALAAAADGFSVRLLTTISDDVLGALCGTAQQSGIEAEHPDLLLAVYPSDSVVEPNALGELKEWAEMFPLDRVEGVAKPLSRGHHNWPVIDEVSASTRVAEIHTEPCWNFPNRSESWTDRAMGARQIVRQRRSAVDMDGETSLSSESFYRVLDRLMPNEVHPVLRLWPWAPAVSLVLFVHRVDGLTPGLYLLVRDPEHEQSLRAQIDARLVWQRPENCPESLLLYRLAAAHVQDAARTISCGQDIAADGVFAVGMLAQMRSTLQTRGAWFYPRLFWETGMIGQMLYLEAEAAGVRGTGIGCFLDDLMHKILGLNPQGDWQSLYHFTVGGALEDTRIQTLDPYFHRNPAE
ncbi:MAG: nitroreductase, partial [Kiritimatiellaceae bacterium]|nr:nitroreductase [Kiritimatiellaceae bacterium]